jgi:hypothetical protein
MSISSRSKDPESRAFWEFVEKAAREVEGWPAWMKGPGVPPSDATREEEVRMSQDNLEAEASSTNRR